MNHTVPLAEAIRFPSAGVAEAWRASFLAHLPARTINSLLAGAHLSVHDTGNVFYRGDRHAETEIVGLVVEGLARIYVKNVDGRQVTIRYLGVGDCVGMPLVGMWRASVETGVSEIARLPPSIAGEAITATKILRISPELFRAVAKVDPILSWALAEYVSEELFEVMKMLVENVFLPVRARVARHLLELAVREDACLVVRASNQDIAGAIGSVREVVSRVLARMKADGLIDRAEDRIVVRDAAWLHRVAVDEKERHPAIAD